MEREKSKKYIQFDGTNFNNWKFRIDGLLEEKYLIEFIETPLEDLVEDLDIEEETKMRLREKKCKNTLIQCIDDSQLEYIKDKKTAKEIIDGLKKVFERKSVAGQLLLRKRLLTMKYSGGEQMQDHFLCFDKTVRDLKAIGATMEDLDIICHLLLSLSESFDTLITAIETLDPDKLTLEFVKSRILDEFEKRSSSNMNNNSVAMHSGRPHVKCFKCGKSGHYQLQCRTYTGNNAGLTGNKINRFNGSSANYSKDEEEENLSDASSFCAFVNEGNNVALIVDSQTQDVQQNTDGQLSFILDSGSTNYMVNDKPYFDELNETKPISIAVAKDGTDLVSNERGNISVTMLNNDGSNRSIKNVMYVKDLKCNLMSVGRLCDKGYEVTFRKNEATVSKNREIVFVTKRNGMLYEASFQLEKKVKEKTTNENNQKLFAVRHMYRSANAKTEKVKRRIILTRDEKRTKEQRLVTETKRRRGDNKNKLNDFIESKQRKNVALKAMQLTEETLVNGNIITDVKHRNPKEWKRGRVAYQNHAYKVAFVTKINQVNDHRQIITEQINEGHQCYHEKNHSDLVCLGDVNKHEKKALPKHANELAKDAKEKVRSI